MKTMIVVVVMVLLTLEIGIAAAYSFSPGLQHALSDGLGKTRFSDMSNIDKTGWEDFGFALKRIDEESDKQVRVWASKNEGKLVEAKIIVLANDYAHRPEIYDHFRKKYMLMPVTNDKVGPVLP